MRSWVRQRLVPQLRVMRVPTPGQIPEAVHIQFKGSTVRVSDTCHRRCSNTLMCVNPQHPARRLLTSLFTDEGTEAPKGRADLPRSPSFLAPEPGSEPRTPCSRPLRWGCLTTEARGSVEAPHSDLVPIKNRNAQEMREITGGAARLRKRPGLGYCINVVPSHVWATVKIPKVSSLRWAEACTAHPGVWF